MFKHLLCYFDIFKFDLKQVRTACCLLRLISVFFFLPSSNASFITLCDNRLLLLLQLTLPCVSTLFHSVLHVPILIPLLGYLQVLLIFLFPLDLFCGHSCFQCRGFPKGAKAWLLPLSEYCRYLRPHYRLRQGYSCILRRRTMSASCISCYLLIKCCD